MQKYQFKPQNNTSLRHKVANDIRDAIINGNIAPGSKLREAEIAEQMGISRGPVREAIRDLEAMGLVVSLPFRETVVADVNKEEIIDLLIPIRLQLELYTLKLSLPHFDEELFDVLDNIVRQMESWAAANDLIGVVEEDIRFHETVLTQSDSPFPLQIWSSIVNRLRIHFIKNTQFFPDLNKVVVDHVLLLEALRTKEYNSIQELWINHIREDDSLLCFT